MDSQREETYPLLIGKKHEIKAEIFEIDTI